jgi:hypothetical protein
VIDAERAHHGKLRWDTACAQRWRCARCTRRIGLRAHGVVYDLLVQGGRPRVFCRRCRLLEDAPARVAKAIETRRLRAAQVHMFAPVWRRRFQK